MKKNSIKLWITNMDKYTMDKDVVSHSLMNLIASRMRCTHGAKLEYGELIRENHEWLGDVQEVSSSIKTAVPNTWGTCYAIHFHHDLEIDGFYERQLVASCVNKTRSIIKEIKKNGANGLGFYKELDAAWEAMHQLHLAALNEPDHLLNKKAKPEQVKHNNGLVYSLISPLTTNFLPSRTVVFDIFETPITGTDKKAITLNIFITSEALEEAPSKILAKENAVKH